MYHKILSFNRTFPWWEFHENIPWELGGKASRNITLVHLYAYFFVKIAWLITTYFDQNILAPKSYMLRLTQLAWEAQNKIKHKCVRLFEMPYCFQEMSKLTIGGLSHPCFGNNWTIVVWCATIVVGRFATIVIGTVNIVLFCLRQLWSVLWQLWLIATVSVTSRINISSSTLIASIQVVNSLIHR